MWRQKTVIRVSSPSISLFRCRYNREKESSENTSVEDVGGGYPVTSFTWEADTALERGGIKSSLSF
jgi:hypothetical protein